MDQTLSDHTAVMDYFISIQRSFCLETNIFNASLEAKYDLFQYTTSKHDLIRFSLSLYLITGGFGKDSGGHSLITDLLQAAKSVGNFALVSNGYGLRLPTNVTDTDVQSEQRILKCSTFRKYMFEQGGMSSTVNQGTGTDSYHVTTHTGDKKRNARGCKSSGLALKRRNSTLRHTSYTCCVKFTLRIYHNTFFLVCQIGENQLTGHPPLHSNEIRNCKDFLDLSTLEIVATMTVANIQLAQAAVLMQKKHRLASRVGRSEFTPGISVLFAVIVCVDMAGKPGKKRKSENLSAEMQTNIPSTHRQSHSTSQRNQRRNPTMRAIIKTWEKELQNYQKEGTSIWGF